jgi:hypothetical protein
MGRGRHRGPVVGVRRSIAVLAALVALASTRVHAQEPPVTPVPQEEPRWSDFLPFLKEEALSRGYQLPLPFGVGTTFTILTGRDIQVNDLSIGIDGAPPQSVSRFVDLGSESDVFNANLKLDTWILPFLNVYLLLGYVYNESRTNVHATVGSSEFDVDVETTLDGFVGGGGLTLAGGYQDFFLVVDSNYSKTDIGFDDRFRALTASLRAGFQGEIGDTPAQIWTGVAYWDTANVAKSTTDVRASDGSRSRPTRAPSTRGCSTSARTCASRASSSSRSTWPSISTAGWWPRSRRSSASEGNRF